MKIIVNTEENKIILSGNTFHLKEEIKSLGGKWDPKNKFWWLSQSQKNIDNLKSIGFVEEESPQLSECSTALTVNDFIQFISAIFKNNLNKNYWVSGEISNLRKSNGHLFFDLVDKVNSGTSIHKTASISCYIWSNICIKLKEKFAQILFIDGTKIKILLRCDFRNEGARIIGIVEDIDIQYTQGELALQRIAIVQELKKSGLYYKNKSHPFPLFPLKIALITAKDSRAYSDFLNEISLAKIAFRITIFDCNMQGEKTSENILHAFSRISQNINSFDCVVLTRGGGSRLDLRWFDDLHIATQIALCPLPVITAIGHFDDISIADEVANYSEKTPTAAARILTNAVLQTTQLLFQRVDGITILLTRRIAKEKNHLFTLNERLTLACQKRIATEKKQLVHMEKILKIYQTHIRQTLQRGYALVYDEQGHLLQGKHFLRTPPPKNLKLKFAGDCENHHIFVDVFVNAVAESRDST